MRLLLDTHIGLWAMTDLALLRAGERSLLASPENPLSFSAVSLWELRLKWNTLHPSGARKGPVDPAAVRDFAIGIGWQLLPLRDDHTIAVLDPPLDHRDPFDELLLVQAQVEGCRLLTRDTRLLGHPLAIGA